MAGVGDLLGSIGIGGSGGGLMSTAITMILDQLYYLVVVLDYGGLLLKRKNGILS